MLFALLDSEHVQNVSPFRSNNQVIFTPLFRCLIKLNIFKNGLLLLIICTRVLVVIKSYQRGISHH